MRPGLCPGLCPGPCAGPPGPSLALEAKDRLIRVDALAPGGARASAAGGRSTSLSITHMALALKEKCRWTHGKALDEVLVPSVLPESSVAVAFSGNLHPGI